MLVKTALGFSFESDDPSIQVGKRVEIPTPVVEEYSNPPDRAINFMAQMYGAQKEWTQKGLGKYTAPEGLQHFPSYILNLPPDRLKIFLTKFCAVNATIYMHYSKTSEGYTPEVWMKTEHESLARELQYLWQRLGVRTRVTYRRRMGKWLVLNSGAYAYIQIRELILNSRNPNLASRLKKADVHVPLQFRMIEQKFTDRVVEISEGEVEDLAS